MINYIKIELKRAFINKTMLFAIIAGCLIAIIQIFVDVVPILQYQDPTNMENFPFTVFEKCLSLIEGSMFPVYYFIFIHNFFIIKKMYKKQVPYRTCFLLLFCYYFA